MAAFLPAYSEAAVYRADQFNPVLVAQSDHSRVLLVCMEPGQFIPVHQPDVDIAIVVLEGEGTLVLDGRQESVRAGAVAFAGRGEARGLKASTRMVVMNVVTPLPSDADHVQVKAKLQEGIWP